MNVRQASMSLTVLTARLRLDPLTRRDLRALHALYADPVLMRWITGKPRTPWETRARLKKDLRLRRDHGFGLCLVREREGGKVVGRCGLIPDPTPTGLEAEIAWMIARPWWGRGYATEVAEALVAYGFDELGLPRIWARAFAANGASVRIMEKLGMVPVAADAPDEVRYELRPSR